MCVWCKGCTTTTSNYSCLSWKQTQAVECVIKTPLRAARQLWVISAVGLYEWINSQALDGTWCRTATIRLRPKMADCSIWISLAFFTNCSGSVACGVVMPHNLRLRLFFYVFFGLFWLCVFVRTKTVEWDWFSISQALRIKKMLYIYNETSILHRREVLTKQTCTMRKNAVFTSAFVYPASKPNYIFVNLRS